MKYSTCFFLYFVLILSDYSHPVKEIKQKDFVIAESIQTVSLRGGNQVKSEAPDAITKSEQGYALPKFDDGLAQSLINILSYKAQWNGSKEISINFNIEVTSAENLGHSIQIDFKEGSTTITDGKTYHAKQFHFHTPSEHLIDGMTFPMAYNFLGLKSFTVKGWPGCPLRLGTGPRTCQGGRCGYACRLCWRESEELDEAMVRFGFAYADQTEKDFNTLSAAAKKGWIIVERVSE